LQIYIPILHAKQQILVFEHPKSSDKGPLGLEFQKINVRGTVLNPFNHECFLIYWAAHWSYR